MKNTFTKQKVTNFRKDFQDAVLELEKKYGVTIKLGTLTYDETSVRGKMSALTGDRSDILTKENFQVGEKVKINHKKVLPNLIFEIIKINSKNIRVVCTSNQFKVINVSPGLLRKI
jgi:hypothetical protein